MSLRPWSDQIDYEDWRFLGSAIARALREIAAVAVYLIAEEGR